MIKGIMPDSMLKHLCIVLIRMNGLQQPPMSQVSSQCWPAWADNRVRTEIILRRLGMSSDVLSNVMELLYVPKITVSHTALSDILQSGDDLTNFQGVADLSYFEYAVLAFDEWQRRIYVYGARCFFAMFECRAQCRSLVNVFEKLYEDRLLHEVFSLDIMNTTLPWARYVIYAFDRLLDFIITEAEIIHREDIVNYAKDCRIQFVSPMIFNSLFDERTTETEEDLLVFVTAAHHVFIHHS